jgi:phospholipid/cholesterol/gamma-HCH transport system permease protein
MIGSTRRWLTGVGASALDAFGAVGAMNALFWQTCYWVFVGPFRERTLYRRQIFRLMEAVGYRSLGIIGLVSVLVGVILVLNTGDVLKRYGALDRIAQLVAVTISRELGPLMTAIVIIARVGASFTAGLGNMKDREEILALQTMGINPVGYLVAPRMIALTAMMPCLTVLALELGVLGGAFMAQTQFHVPLGVFLERSHDALEMRDLVSGMVKSVVFALIVVTVSCYFAFTVRGGSQGVARNTMMSVVTSLVTVVFADAVVSAIFANFWAWGKTF